jgi:hypothetical protein
LPRLDAIFQMINDANLLLRKLIMSRTYFMHFVCCVELVVGISAVEPSVKPPAYRLQFEFDKRANKLTIKDCGAGVPIKDITLSDALRRQPTYLDTAADAALTIAPLLLGAAQAHKAVTHFGTGPISMQSYASLGILGIGCYVGWTLWASWKEKQQDKEPEYYSSRKTRNTLGAMALFKENQKSEWQSLQGWCNLDGDTKIKYADCAVRVAQDINPKDFDKFCTLSSQIDPDNISDITMQGVKDLEPDSSESEHFKQARWMRFITAGMIGFGFWGCHLFKK